jgi:hypothetical protein
MNGTSRTSLHAKLGCKLVLFLGLFFVVHARPAFGVQFFSTEFKAPTGFFQVNSNTAQTTLIGPTWFSPGLDFRANGILYGSSDSLRTISTSNGATTVIGTLPELTISIAFSPSDALYGVSNEDSTLYRIDPSSGANLGSHTLTGTVHVGGSPFPGEINGIDFAPDGRLFGIGFGLYTIDINTGVATRITPLNQSISGDLFLDMDFGADGMIRAFTFDSNENGFGKLYVINPTTGLGQFVGNAPVELYGIASIPEPQSISLVVFALAATIRVGHCRRRWKKRLTETKGDAVRPV